MAGRRWTLAARIVAAALAVAGGLWQLSLMIRLFAAQVRYPWDIEWLESSALYQAYRVMKGMSTYASPKEGFLPLNHPPGYTVTLGLLGKVVGLDYPMARTFSLLCFLAASALVVRGLVRRLGGRIEGWALGALAVGCSAATFPICEGFYILVREDTMAVLLCVIGATLVDGPPRLSSTRVAALTLLITAIVYTRQPAVFFTVWLVLFVWLRHRRTGWLLALTCTASCGLTLVSLQFTSKGWYWMHTIGLIQDHSISNARFEVAFKLLYGFAPFLPVLPVVVVALTAARALSSTGVLWAGMLLAAIPASVLPYAKVGGYSNDFVPVLFLIGPAAAFLAADAIAALDAHPRVRLAGASLFLAAGAAFLYLRTWDIKKLIPTEDAFTRAKGLNTYVARLQGGVLAPRHPFLPIHNGETTLEWSDMPYLDFIWSGFSDTNLGGYIDKAKAKYVMVSGTEIPTTAREISTRYQLEERLGNTPATLIGERSQMRYLFRANDDEKDAHAVFDFENIDGWQVSGEAFLITTARPSGQMPINGVFGRHLANSYNPKFKDPGRGQMISPKFVIDRPRMSLRVGGGWRNGTRVELRVGGHVQRTATGIWEYQETMTRIVWDVSPFQGKEAQLYLIDEDPGQWAHLLCDHVMLY
jgi:hypothetical protein